MTFLPHIIVVCLCCIFISFAVFYLAGAVKKLELKIKALTNLLYKHETEAFDSIDKIKSYTIQSTHMPEMLAISHVCDTEYKRLEDMYNM